MPYVAGIKLDQASPEQKADWQRVQEARGGHYMPEKLYGMLLHNSKMMATWSAHAQALRGFDESGKFDPQRIAIDARTRELALMKTILLTGAGYEWQTHLKMCHQRGVNPEDIQALEAGNNGAPVFSPQEQLVLDYTEAIAKIGSPVREALVKQLQQYMSDQQIVELTMNITFYLGLCQFMVALGIEPD
jgi:alkylhydroperoxidase family enzyme